MANATIACATNAEIEFHSVCIVRCIDQYIFQLVHIFRQEVRKPLLEGDQFLFVAHAVNCAHGFVPAKRLVFDVVFPNANTRTFSGQLKAFVIELFFFQRFLLCFQLFGLVVCICTYHEEGQRAKGQIGGQHTHGVVLPLRFQGACICPSHQMKGYLNVQVCRNT